MGRREPVKAQRWRETATKYSGVVLVVTVFIRYEGRRENGQRKIGFRKQEGKQGGKVKHE